MVDDVAHRLVEHEVSAVLTVTPAARTVVLEARSQEADAERLALWVEVTGARDGAYTYDIYFQAAADARPGDVVERGRRLRRGGARVERGPPASGPGWTGPTTARAGSSS